MGLNYIGYQITLAITEVDNGAQGSDKSAKVSKNSEGALHKRIAIGLRT